MVNSYTSRMEDAIWRDNFTPEECEDFHAVIEYLNSKDFRSFGDGLSALIYKKYPDKEDICCISRSRCCGCGGADSVHKQPSP